MAKRNRKRLLAGLLCAALFAGNIMSAGFQASAADLDNEKTYMDKRYGEENVPCNDISTIEGDSGSDLNERNTKEIYAEKDNTEKEDSSNDNSVEENGKENDEESIEDNTGAADDAENTENETTDSDSEQPETPDADESPLESAEGGLPVTTSDNDIAGGVIDKDYGHIEWVIDAEGKLTVSGTGDFSDKKVSNRAPWYNYCHDIASATINVTGMTNASYMFYDCSYLVSIDVADFDTSNITDMHSMFGGCTVLADLDASGFNTGNVANMSEMFSGCKNLANLDVSKFRTGNVTDMRAMFESCRSVTNLDVSGFDTGNVTDMSDMFSFCVSLTSLDLSSFDTGNVTNMSNMFECCGSLASLDVSRFNTSNVTNISAMFTGCSGLVSIDVSNFDTTKVTAMRSLFSECTSLISADISRLDTSNVTDMSTMFHDCRKLESADLSGLDFGKVTTMKRMFRQCEKLTSVRLSGIGASPVTNMSEMFYLCSSLVNLDLSGLTADKIADMSNMFYYCKNLTTVDMGSFDTSNVTTMFNIFYNCTNLCLIYTPCGLTISVELPAKSGDVWYCSDGSTITELPQNLSYSIAIARNEIPEEKFKRAYPFRYDENIPSQELAKKCSFYSLLAYQESACFLTGVDSAENWNWYSAKKSDDTEEWLGYVLNDEGYENIYSYNYDKAGTVNGHIKSKKYERSENSILYTIGHRRVEMQDGDIQEQVIIVFRGTNGEEWYGNFDVTGKDDDTGSGYNPDIAYHYSFQQAVNDAMKSLAEYIEEFGLHKNDTSGLSIVVTGHSRGAAAANMMAHELTDIRDGNTSGYSASAHISDFAAYIIKSVYAYTFATPNVAAYDKIKSYGEYGNIFNYCFTDDFVPNLPLENWSWGKYGKTYWATAASLNKNSDFQNAARLYFGKAAKYNTSYTDNIVNTMVQATNGKNSTSGIDSYYNTKRWYRGPLNTMTMYQFVRNGIGGVMQQAHFADGAAVIVGALTAERVIAGGGIGAPVTIYIVDSNFRSLADNFICGGKFDINFFGYQALWPALNDTHQCGSYYEAMRYVFDSFAYSELKNDGYSATTYSEESPMADFSIAEGKYNEEQAAAISEFLNTTITIEEYDITVTNADLLGWDSNDVSTWDGITWGSDGVVTSIDIGYCGVVGPLDLSIFTELSKLDCSYDNITELKLGSCTKLEKLYCDGNQLAALDLSGLNSLVELHCSFNQLTDLKLDGCTGLKSLICNSNKLTALALGSCTGLNYLSCDYNYLDVSDNEFMSKMEEINGQAGGLAGYESQNIHPDAVFSQNDIDCLQNIANYGQNSDILGWDMDSPSSWSGVEWVAVNGTFYLKGVDFRGLGLTGTVSFSNCAYLDYILISNNKFTDLGIDNCSALKMLWCAYNYLDSDMLEEIVKKYETLNAVITPQLKNQGGENGDNDPDDDNEGVLPGDIPEGGIPEGFWIAGIKDCPYTGKAIKPDVRVYDGEKRLKAGKDYAVSYKNNIKANDVSQTAAAPTVTVKGKGNYTGTETAAFNILPISLNDTSVITESIITAYNGKLQKKVPTVTYNGKKLANNRDFTVSYPDLEQDKPEAYIEADTYDILLTAKEGGNFTGTRKVEFVITNSVLMNKASIKKIPNQTYTGSSVVPDIAVTMKKEPLTEGIDYTVSYTDNTEIGTATVTLTGTGKYVGTKKATFKIIGTPIKKATVSGIENRVYNGGEHKQDITITLDGQVLSEGTDYELTYANNTKAGKASVTIKGKGAYSGLIKKTFKIIAYDLDTDAEHKIEGMEAEITAKYMKGGCKPEVELSFSGKKLSVGKDYTVSFKNNKAVTGADTKNKPTVIIKGRGNFKGTVKKAFAITAKSLKDDEMPIKLTVPDIAYADKAGNYISKPVLYDTDGAKLAAGKDYTVAYTLEDGTELTNTDKVNISDEVKVNVTGNGISYTGELEAVYRITEKNFGKAKITIPAQTYTGKAVTISVNDIEASFSGTPLIPGTDYKIVEGNYVNNIKKGTASVTIAGAGNYGGTKTVKFKIIPKKVAWFKSLKNW